MLKTYVASVFLVISLVFATVTSGRFIQDRDTRLIKRTMSDQRLAELQALIALSKGHGIPIGHGQLDIRRIGKRRKRSIDSIFSNLDEEQRYRLLDIIMSRDEDLLS